jgi:hypothetical protein
MDRTDVIGQTLCGRRAGGRKSGSEQLLPLRVREADCIHGK